MRQSGGRVDVGLHALGIGPGARPEIIAAVAAVSFGGEFVEFDDVRTT